MQHNYNLDARRAKRILIAQAIATLVVTLIGLIFGPREAFFAFRRVSYQQRLTS